MKRGFLVAVALSVAMLWGGGATVTTGEQTASRTLSVQQTTIKDVSPPAISRRDDRNALDVVAWVDRPDATYARGEHVRLFVQTTKDAYVTVLNVDPSGDTVVLFPNEYQSDNFVRAGRAIEVPDPSSRSKMVVTGTVGNELIKVIASTESAPLFDRMELSDAGPFQMVRAEPRGTARSLVVAMNGPSAGGTTNRPPVTNRPPPGATTASTVGAAGPGVEWAMCHRTIATIAAPTSAAARRTRSLQVLRTQQDGGSATCE